MVFVKFMIEEILTSIATKLVENCRFTCEPLTFLYPTIWGREIMHEPQFTSLPHPTPPHPTINLPPLDVKIAQLKRQNVTFYIAQLFIKYLVLNSAKLWNNKFTNRLASLGPNFGIGFENNSFRRFFRFPSLSLAMP